MDAFLTFGRKTIRVSAIVCIDRQSSTDDGTRYLVHLAGLNSPVNIVLKGEDITKLEAFFRPEE